MAAIKKVAVLGAGVMGAQIAAHLTNCGIPVILFDLNRELVEKGRAMTRKLKPSPYYDVRTADQIEAGDYDHDLPRLGEADWVVEVIAEKLEWKLDLYDRLLPHLKPTAILSSNTSGILMRELVQRLPDAVAQRFCITHFFNPPRYLPLVELITPEGGAENFRDLVELIQERLGKRIVFTRDTPNFIANRIGVFGMLDTIRRTREYGLSVADVDALTGTLIGRQKSATFRTADVVGLDTVIHASGTSFSHAVDAYEKQAFAVPEVLQKLVERGDLGQKTGAGFYKKVDKKTILQLDLETLEYVPSVKNRFDGIRLAKNWKDFAHAVSALYYSDDKAGRFIFTILSDSFLYAWNYLEHFAETPEDVDHAMQWGYGWYHGLFEIWDMVGVQRSLREMGERGLELGRARELMEQGVEAFYRWDGDRKLQYLQSRKEYLPVKVEPDLVTLQKHRAVPVIRNWSADFHDLGDGVGLVDFHSILQPGLNPIDGTIIDTLNGAREYIGEHRLQGLVIGHEGEHFSAGANIALILELAQQKKWDQIDAISKAFQDLNQSLRFAPFPVVAAPFNLALGGGVELIMATDHIVAAAELYAGLVEVGVGLIPGGGGNLRVLLNFADRLAQARPGPFPVVQKAFESIAFAKVSLSAKEAVKYGYLRKSDTIVIPRVRLLETAVAKVKELASEYQPPEYREDIILPGPGGRLALESGIDDFVKKGTISAYDAHLGKKLAYVLTGGERGGEASPVDEQYLLDIEREAFVSLCGRSETRDRLAHMLKTGKPLRN